jgi:O-antigen ligase
MQRLIANGRGRSLLELAGALVLAAIGGLAIAKLGNPDNQLKAVLLLISLCAVAIAVLNPTFALGMLVALVAFEFHFTIGGTQSGTDEALIVGLSLVLVWQISSRAIPTWAGAGGLAIILGSLLSVIGAFDESAALWGAIRWTCALVVFFAAFSLLRDRPDAGRRLMDLWCGAAIIVTLGALMQKAGIFTVVGPPYYAGNIDSFFGYYTHYGAYVAMSALLATGEVVHCWVTRQMGRAVVYSGIVVFVLLGVAVSLSRGALLSIGVGWIVLLVLSVRRGPVLARVAIVLSVFAGAAVLATPPQTRTQFIQRFQSQQSAATDDLQRHALQTAGLVALRQDPFGLGYGNFAHYQALHVHSRFLNQNFFHTHRLPEQMALDAGWIGGLGFLVLVLSPFVLAIRAIARRTGTVRGIAFAAAMAGFLAQGMYDWMFDEYAFVILILALVYGAWHELAGPGADART